MDTHPAFNSYYEKLADGTVRCIDSEIPFDIPDNWAWARMGNACDLVTDFVASGSFASLRYNVKYYPNKGYALLVRTKDFATNFSRELMFTDQHGYEFLSNSNLFGGELILPNIGASIGKVFIVPKLNIRMTLAPNSIMVRTNNESLKMWFYYVFSSPFGNALLASINNSTAQGKFSKTEFKTLLVPIPPKEEQERISSKLSFLSVGLANYDDLFAKIQTLNSSISEALRKSILQEVIQGRLVPQIESEGTAEELLAEITEEKKRLVKEDKLKKSALTASRIFRGDDNKYRQNINGEEIIVDDRLPFEIPDTWRWVTLGELILDSTGLSYKKEFLADKSGLMVRVLRGGNIEEGQMLFKTDDVMISAKYVPDNLYLKQGTFISPAVSSLEKIGKTALIKRDYDNVVAGGFVLLLSPLYSDVNLGKYLYYFFQTGYYHNYCRTTTKKSGQAFYNLSRLKLKECYVPIPPKEELPRILSRIDQVLSSIMSR